MHMNPDALRSKVFLGAAVGMPESTIKICDPATAMAISATWHKRLDPRG